MPDLNEQQALAACPFCGGEPILNEIAPHAHTGALKALIPDMPDHPGSWTVECCDVGMIKDTRAEAIAAWNRRAPAAAPAPVAASDDLRAALAKINEIRNSIIGLQSLNWSEHVYPLVAALDAAGFEGMGYPEARKNYGTLLERAVKAEDALAALAAAPAPAAAPIVQPVGDELTPLDYRAQGREEALAALLAVEPESGINDYMDSGRCPATGEYDTGWNEAKLREMFAIGDCKHDAYDRAEAAYWQAQGEKDEAERAKNFAANMHGSGKVREVLAAAGEYGLIATLCTTSTANAKDAVRLAALEEAARICDNWRYQNSNYAGHCADAIRAAITSSAGEVKP